MAGGYRKNHQKQVLILFSGGIDSTACIHYYKDKNFSITGLFIDYVQPAFEQEKQSVEQISSFFNIPIKKIQFRSTFQFKSGEITGRNAAFIFSALMSSPNFSGLLALGIHSGTSYYDCSKQFAKDVQKIIDGYTNGTVIVDLPFLEWNKEMIVEYSLTNDLPIELTYSCETGGEKPCGTCLSCRDRKKYYENKNSRP